MITLCVLLGLIVVTVIAGFTIAPKISFAVLIPLLYLSWYFGSSEVPRYFGYSVPVSVIRLEKATVLWAAKGVDKIYVLVKENGSTQGPRLVSMEDTAQNRKALQKMKEAQEKGKTVQVDNGSMDDGVDGDVSVEDYMTQPENQKE